MEEKNFFTELLDLGKIVLIALAIVIPIRFFIFQPFMVSGASMEPNFHNTDYLIIDELSYRFKGPERGDVVVFKYPKNEEIKYIKRIIGFPGETVEIKDAKVMITDVSGSIMTLDETYLQSTIGWVRGASSDPITLNSDEYFVLGDNRNNSSDSRSWGVLPKKDIIGKVAFTFSLVDILNKKTDPNIESN